MPRPLLLLACRAAVLFALWLALDDDLDDEEDSPLS